MRTFNGLQIFTEQLTNSGQLDQRYATLGTNQTITGQKTFTFLQLSNSNYIPTGVNSPGFSGQVSFDQDFIYLCTSGDGVNGVWRGAPLLNWTEI